MVLSAGKQYFTGALVNEEMMLPAEGTELVVFPSYVDHLLPGKGYLPGLRQSRPLVIGLLQSHE